MAQYKVEICGVNTSRLPLLKNDEKDELFSKILEGDSKAREKYTKEIFDLCLVLYRDFLTVRKILTICFRLAVSAL